MGMLSTFLTDCFVPVCMHGVVIWRNLVLRNGGKVTASLDLSALSKVSDGYTGAQMNTALQQILTERRIHQVGCCWATYADGVCVCVCVCVLPVIIW